MSQPHENLIAWQRADDMCVEVYRITRRLPAAEQFGLASQLRRAAFSVPANIVEGYAFPKSPTRLRHLRIAVASLAEVGYGLRFASKIGYLSDTEWNVIDLVVRQTAAPLHGLLKQQSNRASTGE